MALSQAVSPEVLIPAADPEPSAPTLLHFPGGPSASHLVPAAAPPTPARRSRGKGAGTPQPDSQGQPQPRMATSHPDAMVAADLPYSLLDDIRQAQAQHAGAREKVALYGFPSYLATNIRRVLARNPSHRADWSVALSCLVWQGLLRYAGLATTKSLSAALLDLDTDDGLEAVAGEQIELWRRGFKFVVQDPTHTMGVERCRRFVAPEHVHAELHDMAGRLGLSGSTLGIMAIMAALEDQEGVLAAHGEHMRGEVARLDGLLGERERRLGSLVRAIEAGVWG